MRKALGEVCAELSELVVRNGEGCNHLIRVAVTGATDEAEARGVGKAVVNSPLFKCAVSVRSPQPYSTPRPPATPRRALVTATW